jgi:hypothetical protein
MINGGLSSKHFGGRCLASAAAAATASGIAVAATFSTKLSAKVYFLNLLARWYLHLKPSDNSQVRKPY